MLTAASEISLYFPFNLCKIMSDFFQGSLQENDIEF